MIGNVSRLLVTANRLPLLKRSGYVWGTSEIRRNMHLLLNKALINGEWVSAKSNEQLPILNPANGETIGTVPDLSVQEVNQAIDAAHAAFHSTEWRSLTAKERAGLLKVRIILN